MEQAYAPPRASLEQEDNNATYQPRMWALHGRIGRVRYLVYSMVVSWILMFVLGIFSAIMLPIMTRSGTSGGVIIALIYLPLFAVGFVYTRRRLHDLGKNAWLSLLILVPVINLFFGLYLLFAPGDPVANDYGPKPAAGSVIFMIAAVIVPILFIFILAAIALPAYQDYTIRAKANSLKFEKQRSDNATHALENSPSAEEMPKKE